MLILKEGEKVEIPCVLVLGGFDGLHLGHRALLSRARTFHLPIALTTILGCKGSMLFLREEREFLFERAGIDVVIEWDFTQEFRNLSAEAFCENLLSRITPELILCGEDFCFGKGALGNPALLKSLAPCPVEVLPAVKSDYMRAKSENFGMRKISTSALKEHLSKGELPLLNACLKTEEIGSCAYFLMGKVEHGRAEGRKYGFPTLNLKAPPQKLLPPDGVYGGWTATERGNFPSIINFGACPTFCVEERKVEAHLIGFEGDLYGTTVRVYPTEFLRPIQRFSSPEELKIQLQKDKERFCI